ACGENRSNCRLTTPVRPRQQEQSPSSVFRCHFGLRPSHLLSPVPTPCLASIGARRYECPKHADTAGFGLSQSICCGSPQAWAARLDSAAQERQALDSRSNQTSRLSCRLGTAAFRYTSRTEPRRTKTGRCGHRVPSLALAQETYTRRCPAHCRDW